MALRFPSGFAWGAATSAYQVEGAAGLAGRGESIWDRFSRTAGNVANNDTGDVACDHYHRWPEDIALLRELGVGAYRFSVAWPRVIPDGDGPVNEAGLDFYDRLVDALLEGGITPFLTLYHWDLPQALQDAGGWPNRATVPAFVRYAEVVARRLGDRVQFWTTHNEPQIAAWNGYYLGEHAPGLRDLGQSMAAGHHLLVSHGLAVQALRAILPASSQIGIVLAHSPVHAASEHVRDRLAAFRTDTQINRSLLNPLSGRGYPREVLIFLGKDRPPILPGDEDLIATPLDFIGLNYYSRHIAESSVRRRPRIPLPNAPRTDMGWEIYPRGIHEALRRVHAEYGFKAIYITENGAAFPDDLDSDGAIRDEDRIAYLREHLAECHRAISDGVPLKGYFVWSLLDNFEWAHGYSKRFGLVHVDYRTQQRRLKSSAHWYARVVRANAVDIDEV